jgi:hypothetical protein
VFVPSDDDPDPRMIKKGSNDPELKMSHPNPLPFTSYNLNVRSPRESVTARKTETPRRSRTSKGVAPSVAYDPFYDGG